MSIFTNKQNFADRPEIMRILEALEVAHAKQDELSASILLTRLSQYNIKLEAESSCNKVENALQ